MGSWDITTCYFKSYLKGKEMKYTKKFASLDALNAFVDFHKEETGLIFSSNRELRMAWIEVEETIYQDLKYADMFD